MDGEQDTGCVNIRVICMNQKQPSSSDTGTNVCLCKLKEWRDLWGAVKTWKIVTYNKDYGKLLFRER